MGTQRRGRRSATRAPGNRLILVVGGSASGKSERALGLAGRAEPRAFVATGQPLDAEMAQRIQRHQVSRGPGWHTAEVPLDVAAWCEAHRKQYRAVVVDCLTLWLSNLRSCRVADEEVPKQVDQLLRALRTMRSRLVVVTNELGMGLVPMDPDTRRFRDLAGLVNQQFAREADEVHLVVSGLSVRLK